MKKNIELFVETDIVQYYSKAIIKNSKGEKILSIGGVSSINKEKAETNALIKMRREIMCIIENLEKNKETKHESWFIKKGTSMVESKEISLKELKYIKAKLDDMFKPPIKKTSSIKKII